MEFRKIKVPGYDFYYIDSEGMIYGKSRILSRIIHPIAGYYSVTMYLNGVRKTVYIHRLVAQLFIPNPENKREVNHINGIKTDNRVENLEWVTPKENIQHAIRTGLRTAYCSGKQKLTPDDVLLIRTLYYMYNIRPLDMGKMFGVAPCTISQAVHYVTWKSI